MCQHILGGTPNRTAHSQTIIISRLTLRKAADLVPEPLSRLCTVPAEGCAWAEGICQIEVLSEPCGPAPVNLTSPCCALQPGSGRRRLSAIAPPSTLLIFGLKEPPTDLVAVAFDNIDITPKCRSICSP